MWQLVNSQNSGLPAGPVSAIVEDASGALWFAVYGGGLARLSPDGREGFEARFSADATCRQSCSLSITHGPAIKIHRLRALKDFQMAASLSTSSFYQ